MNHKQVQDIARNAMRRIREAIRPGMALVEVRRLCERTLKDMGADSFWYWNVGAFCFAGDETAVSVSGRNYITSPRLIQADDIITIDLSPQCDGVWGDYARTIIIENGSIVQTVSAIQNKEWREGLQMEDFLHSELKAFATPHTIFEELHAHINEIIHQNGYKKLDFLGNLGHSIAQKMDDRIYIEHGNHSRLSAVPFFTFEPHIGIHNSTYGFKKENIYFFENEMLVEL